jgi:hypothetical protein
MAYLQSTPAFEGCAMKLLLLAVSLVALGGCVAPGYEYVQPDYAGAGGYYSGGYSAGGYYPDYYGGCCNAAGVSIGYGYGYPGYYAGGNYPYGYYGSYGYYGYYPHGGGRDGDDGHGSHSDDPQPWRSPDHPPIPHHGGVVQSEWSAPPARMISPSFPPRIAPRVEAPPPFHTTGHAVAPVRSWTPPPRPSKSKTQQF